MQKIIFGCVCILIFTALLSAAACTTKLGSSYSAGPSELQKLAQKIESSIITVEAWGGTSVAKTVDPAILGKYNHSINKITLHHQGESYPAGTDARQYLRQLQNWSRASRLWLDIPYHYIIDLDGNIYAGRDIAFSGETNTDYNPSGHALIEVVGNFEEVEPNQAQLDAVIKTMTMLAAKYRLSPDAIAGHKNYSNQTVCPGKNLNRYLENGYFRDRVRANLNAAML